MILQYDAFYVIRRQFFHLFRAYISNHIVHLFPIQLFINLYNKYLLSTCHLLRNKETLCYLHIKKTNKPTNKNNVILVLEEIHSGGKFRMSKYVNRSAQETAEMVKCMLHKCEEWHLVSPSFICS